MLTMSDITASGVAQLFRDHMWNLHRLPEELISQTEWVNQEVKQFI